MHPDKSAGNNGFSPIFFQHYWELNGVEIFDCCREWLKEFTFPSDLNNRTLVLIPKKENAERMSDLRPIALCNVLYKILAKVLTKRLKVILPGLILEKQSTFVLRRNISDSVLVVYKMIHFMKRKNKGQDGEVALKLDISKAYDRMNWQYLKCRVKGMDQTNKWIKWVMLCVTTVNYIIAFNGSSIGLIIPGRGLR